MMCGIALLSLVFWFASSLLTAFAQHTERVKALHALRNSLQDNSPPLSRQPVEALTLRVQELIQQGDTHTALMLVEQALQQHQNNAGLLNLLGIIQAQQGQYRAAEKAFRGAILLSPKFVGALLNLGRLYQENQNLDADASRQALEVYSQVLRTQPANVEAHYQSAVLLVAQKQYRQSLAHLSQIPADRRASAQVLAVLLACKVGLDEQPQAATMDSTFKQLMGHPDLSEPDLASVIPTLTTHGRSDLAIKLYEELDYRGKASAGWRRQLALIEEQQGRLAEARALLEKSATADDNLTPLLIDLARLARKQKDYQGALGYLAHAREKEPANAKIHYLFGLVCLDSNLLSEAHQAFQRAVTLNPNEPLYNYAMGLVAAYRSDPAEAIPYLQKYLLLKPADPRGKLALGVAFYNHKDFAAARQPLLEAARSSETAEAARFHLASIARQEGKLDEAAAGLRDLLRVNPRFADALAELGQCSLQQKDYRAAQDFFTRALSVDSDHYLANFGLLVLYSRTKDEREKTQAERFAALKERRFERARDLLRTIEIRPTGRE